MVAAEAPPQGGEMTTSGWLRAAVTALDVTSPSPRADAELILSAALQTGRGHLLARPDEALDAACISRADEWVTRRQTGEPVAYLLGQQAFWSLSLQVTSQVLVPRSETEGVVERALAAVATRRRPCILELGTGSGAIALALAHERPDAVVVATDCSTAALAVARTNARRLGLPVTFVAGNWYAALAPDMQFDLIVSNPPYVARGDPALEPAVAHHEPGVALYAEDNGLAALTEVVDGAPAFLEVGGHLVLEHGATQAVAVTARLTAAGFVEVRDEADLAGLPRVASGCWPGKTTHD